MMTILKKKTANLGWLATYDVMGWKQRKVWTGTLMGNRVSIKKMPVMHDQSKCGSTVR